MGSGPEDVDTFNMKIGLHQGLAPAELVCLIVAIFAEQANACVLGITLKTVHISSPVVTLQEMNIRLCDTVTSPKRVDLNIFMVSTSHCEGLTSLSFHFNTRFPADSFRFEQY